MNNFIKRLILTLVCIPLLIFIIFWPLKTHIIFFIMFGIIVTFLGSYEFGTLIYKKGINVRRFFLPIINTIIYLFAYIYANNFFNINDFKPALTLFFSFLTAILSFIYARDFLKKDLTFAFEKMSYTLFAIIYIGLPSFISPFIFNIDENPVNKVPLFFNINTDGTLTGSLLAFYFIVLVFSNDIFAYVFGMLFGRNNVIGLTASPNKSWAGYIGAFLSTYVWVALFYFFLFKRFTNLPWWLYFSFPAISGIFVPIGDLAESVIKRSVNVKDSGSLIMGRGGVLDSVDSILYMVPIYFALLQIYFAFKSTAL